MRRYRTACFAILAVALARRRPADGLVVDRTSLRSASPALPSPIASCAPAGHPAVWVAGGWARAAASACCRGARHRRGHQPGSDLVRAARRHPRRPLRAARHGRRHRLHPRALLRLHGPSVDPAAALEAHSQDADRHRCAGRSARLILSGALVESDRAHRRRSTLDPLTGLFNRNALEQRLAELDGPAKQSRRGPLARAAALRSRSLQARQRPAWPRRRRRGPAGRRLHDAGGAARRRFDLPGRRRGDPRRSFPAPTEKDADGGRRAAAHRAVRKRRPGRHRGDDQHRRRRLQAQAWSTQTTSIARADAALYAAKAEGRDTGFSSTAKGFSQDSGRGGRNGCPSPAQQMWRLGEGHPSLQPSLIPGSKAGKAKPTCLQSSRP